MNLRRRFSDQRGFNLIELMIVIAIIGLLIGVGSIAWSSIVKSGNETAATTMLERMRTFQAQYAARNRGRFATFKQLADSGVLDQQYAVDEEPVVNGYKFAMQVTEPTSTAPARYEIWADPLDNNAITGTGTRYFYTNSSLGSTKAKDGERATAEDPSI